MCGNTLGGYCAHIGPKRTFTSLTGRQKVPSLSVAVDELWCLTSPRPAVLLIGGYDGSGNYGDVCLFEAAMSLLSELDPEFLLLPVIERQHMDSHNDLCARMAPEFGAACFLYYDGQEVGASDGLPPDLAPVPLQPAFRSSAIYFYGGGYLNEMWGPRKLAMARAVEDWITPAASRGSQEPQVVFTGQQVSAGFAEDQEAGRWLRRASLFGVRDLRSGEVVTGLFPELVERGAVVVAEDDTVGILCEIPVPSELHDARPRDWNGDLRVDLHLTGEGYATTDTDRLARFAADLLSAIQREANAHVSVRLVVAYDDRRISERPFLQDFAATFLVSAGGGGQVSFTIEDATTRRLLDPGWEQRRPDLTISCSYHVRVDLAVARHPRRLSLRERLLPPKSQEPAGRVRAQSGADGRHGRP